MSIDLSRFRVFYDGEEINALALINVEDRYVYDEWPPIKRPKYITVLAIDKSGSIISITDYSQDFKFLNDYV